jgi:hypothetical protein
MQLKGISTPALRCQHNLLRVGGLCSNTLIFRLHSREKACADVAQRNVYQALRGLCSIRWADTPRIGRASATGIRMNRISERVFSSFGALTLMPSSCFSFSLLQRFLVVCVKAPSFALYRFTLQYWLVTGEIFAQLFHLLLVGVTQDVNITLRVS